MLNDSHSTVGSLPPNWSLPKNLPIALPEQGEEPQIEVSTIQYDKTPSDDRYLDQLRILRRSAEIKGTARPRGTKTNPMSAFKNIRQSIMGFLPHSSTTGS